MEKHGEGTPWFHLGTRDFVHFTDYGQALTRGPEGSQDLYVFTGSVVKKDDLFHIFYTGHNHHLVEIGRAQQAIMHATSPDLMTWTKDPTVTLYSDGELYELNDWRDPFVFWNGETGEYWMLIAARLRKGPINRRGCIALCASKDLIHWEIRRPFWAPGLYYTHECPDLFHMGDRWYLLYSTFTDRFVTHYRMSRSLKGPWIAPENDSFDSRAFYAAKTASDGKRRFAFGWNPTREGDKDEGAWQWGGNIVVHEIVQRPNGDLVVKVPMEVDSQFRKPMSLHARAMMGTWHIGETISSEAIDSFAWCLLGGMPEQCKIRTTVTWDEGTRSCGVILRTDENLDNYYQLRLEPGRQRVVFDRCPRPGDQPFMLERPLVLERGKEVEIKIFVEDTIIEIYLDDVIAMSTRGYNHRNGSAGLFVSEGKAAFNKTELTII